MNVLLFKAHEVDPDGLIRLTDRRATHIHRVLRATPGKQLRAGVLDGARGTAEVLHTEPAAVTLRFRRHRFEVIGLGPRILRTETACVALLSRFALSFAHETQPVDPCTGDRFRNGP